MQCEIMAKRLAEAEIALKKALRGASEKVFTLLIINMCMNVMQVKVYT